MSILKVDFSVLEKQVLAQLNSDMLAAAEPLIQKALAEVEKEMRKNLAANLVSMIDSEVDFMRDQRQIVIKLRS